MTIIKSWRFTQQFSIAEAAAYLCGITPAEVAAASVVMHGELQLPDMPGCDIAEVAYALHQGVDLGTLPASAQRVVCPGTHPADGYSDVLINTRKVARKDLDAWAKEHFRPGALQPRPAHLPVLPEPAQVTAPDAPTSPGDPLKPYRLVGTAEWCELLNTSRETWQRAKRSGYFPPPDTVRGKGHFWQYRRLLDLTGGLQLFLAKRPPLTAAAAGAAADEDNDGAF